MGIGRSFLSVNQNERNSSIESSKEDNLSFVPICSSVAYVNKETNASQKIQVLGSQTGTFIKTQDQEGTSCLGNVNESLFAVNKMKIYQENIELWQMISNLATTNKQISAAHNLTLDHLQWFFAEFKKQQTQPFGVESTDKRKNAKASCSDSARKENYIKNDGRARATSGKQNTTVKTMRKKLRRLKKLSAMRKSINNDFESQEIEIGLRREIEELNTVKLESQATKNNRLINYLKEQRLVIEQLTQDFEGSRQECEDKEKSLVQLLEKLNRSELRSTKLLAKLETLQCERSGITRMAKEEAEKSLILKARLVEQDEERNNQILALDEATQQIRALELTIQELTAGKAFEPNEFPDSQLTASVSTSSANEEFKKELMLKREARQRAIAAISSEMDRLKHELETEKIAHLETKRLLENLHEVQKKSIVRSTKTDDNDNLKKKTDRNTLDHIEALRLSDLLKLSDEVTSDLWLQLDRTDDLRFQLENNPEENRLRIGSLKQLSEDTRATLRFRKQQVDLLKDRLAQILARLDDQSFLDKPDEIRIEAKRQIEDIARSRNISDERSRILAELKDHCYKEIHELKLQLDNSRKENRNLEEDLRKTENKMDAQDAEILNLESHLGLAKADCRDLQNQMSVINSLFTQMLLGASSAEMDLDRLTRLLQENHDLISDMAKENGTEAAALPKLLLDIIEQVDGRASENEDKKEKDDLQQESIAHNLPKVWRVLLELLSCHVVRTSESGAPSNSTTESAPDSCYKSIDTPTGPRLVISVSKTYIRLKELILEKKHLEKEMNRMKQLNTHLESKLSEQEKRLSTVSDELSKTWNIVGRMQAQHQQLHTHEKILRYELQQKRKMLQELKQELEYCREKWESARQKNTNTEIEWRSLRREFAARKALVTHADSFNNSGESGFSDEREESDEDDDKGDIGKRIRPINSRRRPKKDTSRTMTPNTETEQPADTDLSELELSSAAALGQRTPTPESEDELQDSEFNGQNSFSTTLKSNLPTISESTFDPLDKALTNVIEKLIQTDESNYTEGSSASGSDNENININSANQEIDNETSLANENRLDKNVTEINSQGSNEAKLGALRADSKVNYPTSVFTIGPIPNQIISSTNIQFSNAFPQNPSNAVMENSPKLNSNESITLKTDKKVPPKLSELFSEIDCISTDSSSSLETVKEFTSDQPDRNAPLSSEVMDSIKIQTEMSDSKEIVVVNDPSTEVLDDRATRLRNLEEQAKWLVKKVSDTNRRSSTLNLRLEVLHETYGSTPEAPPMPDILPTFRLQTEERESENSESYIQSNDNEIKARDD